MIYISRDVRDVVISMYYFAKNMLHRDIHLEDYLRAFLNDEAVFGPYREHCIDFWNIPDYEEKLILTYESVVGKIDETIAKVAEFLGKEVSEENFGLLKEHLKFDSMKSE